MSAPFRLTFLGTSTSVGVPVIGCPCPVCHSEDRRDNRTRSSILVSGPFGNALVDTGPDLREQALREGFDSLEAVLYTHTHADHILGFDELRAFCWHREEKLPLYGSAEVLAELARLFPWAFSPDQIYQGYVRPEPRPVIGPEKIIGLTATPVKVLHGNVPTHGYRFDLPNGYSLAYLSDVKSIPETSLPLLQNLDLLILDGLRERPHPTHLSIPEALELRLALKARQTCLTHLSHEVSHAQLEKNLPADVFPAYDGLNLQLTS